MGLVLNFFGDYTLYMKFNVDQVLARSEERKKEVKPITKVVLPKPPAGIRSPIAKKILSETPPELREKVRQYGGDVVKESLLKELWKEMSDIKTARGKLSTRSAYLVAEVAEKLMKESAATARSFMAGELPIPEIREHYAKIQALTDHAIAIWDKIQYVEQYGHLPVPPEAAPPTLEAESPEASTLQHQIRRLDDRIHKTRKKLAGQVPKNPSRVALWKEKLAMDEIQRDELKRKLKSLQYGARAQRSGEA